MDFLTPLFFLYSVSFWLQYNNVLGKIDNINMIQNRKSLPLDFGNFKKGYPKHRHVKCDIYDYELRDVFDYNPVDNYLNIDNDGYDYPNNESPDTLAVSNINSENYNPDTDAIVSSQQIANLTERGDQNSDEIKDTNKKENRRIAQGLLNYFTAIKRNAKSDSNRIKSQRINDQESVNNQIKKDKTSSIINKDEDQYNERLKKWIQML